MKLQTRYLIPLASLMLFASSCRRGPSETIIMPEQALDRKGDLVLDLHKVEILKVQPGEAYLFIEVTEDGNNFWIATGPGNVRNGATYYFNEAVRKENFESESLDRVFDSIYLVPRLVPESRLSSLEERIFDPHDPESFSRASDSTLETPPMEEPSKLSIADLVKAPSPYENKWVEIRGTCVKVNPAIMDRNWVHLEDPDAEGAQVVVTTEANVKEGETVTFHALVRQNRDFGSGYRYDLLLENGMLVR